jgi:outer membrane protein assembly factor BamB
MPRLVAIRTGLTYLAILAALARPTAGFAQRVGTANLPFATDAALGKALDQAREHIQKQAWPEAVRQLQTVLDASADGLVPVSGKDAAGRPAVHGVSARAEANRLLAGLPPAALDLYEQLYGARARLHLAEAIVRSGTPGVARVAQRYPHTQAGRTARALLERPSSGKDSAPADAGRDWPLFRGDASRSARAEGDLPFLEPTWRRTTLPDGVESRRWLEQALPGRPDEPLPGSVPLTVGGRLVFRTYLGVAAVDLKTGELDWESRSSGSLSGLIDHDPAARARVRSWFGGYAATHGQYVLAANSMLGTLSSDGRCVYAVDDLAVPPPNTGGAPHQARDLAGFGVLESAVRHSRLTAIDLESGKIVWGLGWPGDEGELKDCYFLGPPLPVSGRLYALTERGNELRLACLDPAARGAVRWVRKVATVSTGLLQDPARRLQAVVLAYADGVLVCPTHAGVLLGIDPVVQAPLWAYAYPTAGAGAVPPRSGMSQVPYSPAATQFNPPAWHYSAPVVQDGKVIFTAPDAAAVHCLNLRDGAPLWQAARRDDVYVVGATDGKVVLVGTGSCRALSLADGKQLWRVPTGPPAGLGVLGGGRCFLPLRAGGWLPGAGICAVDLARGTVAGRSPAGPKDPLGNLLFHGGSLLTQTATTVAAYPLLRDELQRAEAAVRKAPGDAAARFERGRARTAAGDLAGAAEDLAAAIESAAAADRPRLRQNLYEVLTRLLQENFSEGEKYLETYRDLCQIAAPQDAPAAERAALADEQQRRQALLRRLLAEGWDRQRRPAEALQAYLDYSALAGSGLVGDRGDAALELRPDLWVRRQLVELFRRAAPEQRRALEAEIVGRWQALQARGSGDLRRLVTLLAPDTRLGREFRLELAERLAREGDVTQAALYLLPLRSRPERGIAQRAAALLDRITGSAPPALPRPPSEGPPRVEELPGEGPTRTLTPLRPRGELPPSLGQCRLVLLQAPPRNELHLALLDADTGAERWRLPLPPATSNIRPAPHLQIPCFVAGPVLVLPLGGRLYGFDLLGRRLLWEREWPGTVVLASPTAVCLRTRDGLEGLETGTGQFRWTRAEAEGEVHTVGGAERLYLVDLSDQGRPEAARAVDLADGRVVPVPNFAPLYSAQVPCLGRTLLLTQKGPRGETTLRVYDIEAGKDVWRQTFPAGSLPVECRAPGQAGMVEPNGTVRLFDVSSGKEILHASLGGPPPPRANAAQLLQDRSRFYLILNDRADTAAQANFGSLASTVLNGTVWAFHRDGRLRWHTTEPIIGQALLLERFEELPALVFSTRVANPKSPAQGASLVDVVTRFLDKATGKNVYDRGTPVTGTAGQFYDLRIDRAAGTVDLLSDVRVLRSK